MRRSWWAAGRSASRSSRPSGCAAPSPSWRPTSRPRGARSPSGWGRTWSSIRRGSARSTPGRPPPVRVRPSSSSASACPGSSTSSCATRRARRASWSSASAWRTIASVPCTASTRSCRCSSCSATRRRSSRSRSPRSPRGASLSRRWSRDGSAWTACRARSRRSRTPTRTQRSWSSRGGELTGRMLGLVCVTALVLAVVALSRTAAGGSLTERIAALEREVRQLRALLQAREAAPERAEKPEPAPVREPAAPQAVAPPAAPPFPARPAAPPPPPAAPPRPAAPPPVSAPRVEIDWEQLFGVRAAAGLGGVALALAGLLFFKYSVEHGLVPPWLRVVLGTVVGVACIAGSEWRLRREYARTADALAGAGMVVLYAAFWAASIRYGLVPTPVAFVLMVAVTASGCILSWRHSSQVIASLGLIGGFLTPLLLSTGTDRPIGLFGYVLLLDTGLLYLARQRRWPVLALLSLAGTVFYQALWIGTRMGPERLLLGLAILGAFALLFAAAPRLAGGEEADLEWLVAQAGGVLVPFAFVLCFASSTRFSVHFHPYGILLVPLSAAAGWIAAAQRPYRIGLGAAAATVAIVGAWLFTRAVGAGLAWEAAFWSVLLALTFHVFVEWERQPSGQGSPAPAAIVASLGFFVLLIVGSATTSMAEPWPWLAGPAGLAALLVRHATLPAREFRHLVAALGMGVALADVARVHGRPVAFPPLWVYFAVLLGAALALQVVALARRSPGTGPRSPPPPGSSPSGGSTCSASVPARSASCPSRWRWCRSPPRCGRASAGRRAIPFASA